MVLLQLDSGETRKLDPRVDEDLRTLDHPQFYKSVRRVSIIDGYGRRTDLPLNKNGVYRMWMERVEYKDVVKGERFCMKTSKLFLRVTMYYSDSRVVVDLNPFGGFING